MEIDPSSPTDIGVIKINLEKRLSFSREEKPQRYSDFIKGLVMGLFLNVFAIIFLRSFASKNLKDGLMSGMICSVLMVILAAGSFAVHRLSFFESE